MTKIVLASGSPRRKELLEQVGLKFDIIPAKGEEVITSDIPCEVVQELSKQKAAEIAKQFENEDVLVIGADTLVAFGDKIMGKPKDEEMAYKMLSELQGNTHQVYTGVTLIKKEKTVTFYEKTDVYFYPMTKNEIEDYIATREPMDKAGAYGIQGIGAKFVKGINGDYNNVVGLPVARLLREMKGVN